MLKVSIRVRVGIGFGLAEASRLSPGLMESAMGKVIHNRYLRCSIAECGVWITVVALETDGGCFLCCRVTFKFGQRLPIGNRHSHLLL